MSVHYDVTVGYLPDEPPPLDPDWGYPGNRPAVIERPGPTNTGARFSTTQTLTGAQAMSAILSAPIEADGKRYLRRAHINGNLNLNSTGNNAIVFEDCTLSAMDSLYAISAFYTAGMTEPLTWPEFRYCTLQGGTSATLRGGWVRFLRCDLSHGVDILKPFQGLEVWASWLHDNWKTPGAHGDTIQIVGGCSGADFISNYFYGFASLDAPTDPGDWNSGVLQSGPIGSPTGVPEPVRFLNNWVAGGRFGFRGTAPNNGLYPVNMIFSGNRFIRGSFQYGPTAHMEPTENHWDSNNVWDDDDTPVTPYGGV